MITSPADISVSKKISESLYLLDVKLDKFRQWVPGMFLQLALEPKSGSEPWLDSRAFSIASWGDADAKLLVRIEGNFTRRLTTLAEGGFKAAVRYPFGSFFLNSNGPKVFLAAGAGISVFLSHLDYLKKNNINEDLIIYHQAKKDAEALEQIYWMDIPDNVSVRQYISREHSILHKNGKFSLEEISFDVGKSIERWSFYICGPPGFNSDWSRILSANGLKAKTESWIKPD